MLQQWTITGAVVRRAENTNDGITKILVLSALPVVHRTGEIEKKLIGTWVQFVKKLESFNPPIGSHLLIKGQMYGPENGSPSVLNDDNGEAYTTYLLRAKRVLTLAKKAVIEDEREDMYDVFLHGHLGRDSEMRYTKSGDAVLGYSIAVPFYNAFGAKEEGKPDTMNLTTWFNCSTWGDPERLQKYQASLAKGTEIVLTDVILNDTDGMPRMWEGKDGIRASYDLTVYQIDYCGKRGSGTSNASRPAGVYGASEELDDIPF